MSEKPIYVLIEDDKAIQQWWKEAAAKANITLHVLSEPDLELFHSLPTKQTKIYMDINLEGSELSGRTFNGLNFSELLSDMGFTDIHIITSTGAYSEKGCSVEKPDWVTSISNNKTPPF